MDSNRTGCRLPPKQELRRSQHGSSIYPPLLITDVWPKSLGRTLWGERTYQCHQTQASSSQPCQHRHRNSWRRSQQRASNLPCLQIKVFVQQKLLKTALSIRSKWEGKHRVTPWFIAVTRKAGVFRTSGLHPSPKTGSVVSRQSGRCLYSLTPTSFLSQGFHTLPASLFWWSNILARKKLFPTSNLKHCYISSHRFFFPRPWTWRTDYPFRSAAAFCMLYVSIASSCLS